MFYGSSEAGFLRRQHQTVENNKWPAGVTMFSVLQPNFFHPLVGHPKMVCQFVEDRATDFLFQ